MSLRKLSRRFVVSTVAISIAQRVELWLKLRCSARREELILILEGILLESVAMRPILIKLLQRR